MTTKELIYHNALKLFAQYGYMNVGMRELAKSVGIKASSIYNHYKSKEDILMDIAQTLVNRMKEEVYPLFKQTHLEPRAFFTNISLSTNHFFEKDDIHELTSLLIPLEFLSEPLKELLHQEFIIKPRAAYTYYFNDLMKKGKMKETNPDLAAKLYHSFFVYHFYEKYLSKESKGFMEKYEILFKEHIDLFMTYFNIQ